MAAHKQAGAGSFTIRRIPGGSSANHIRSYLKLYETEKGHVPDVLIVDYLDLMSPNVKNSAEGVFEKDKQKSEELAEIAFDYNCIAITASQQNREAVRSTTPDQASIAGGISKINTVDNYISIYMNPEMRIKGEMFIYFLKTRSSKAVGSMSQLCFNPDNLIVSDHKTTTVSILSAIQNRKNRENSIVFPGVGGVGIDIPDEFTDSIIQYHQEQDEVLPSVKVPQHNETIIDIDDDDKLWQPKPKFKIRQEDAYEDLIDLVKSIQ